jgi:hypothetical protein
MATPSQVLIMAGFDYQGGGVGFAAMARNRQARLLAANTQLTVTVMDVGAGATTVSAMTPDPAGKLVRTMTRTQSNSPVTAANYSAGLRHGTRFDKNQSGRMSITDLYAAVEAIGDSKDTAGSLVEVSVFSHGFFDGPILVDSNDASADTARDPDDKDARAQKDFKSPNMTAAQLAAFKSAFAPNAFWWNWDCLFAESYRQVTHRFINSPLYRRTPAGTLKDTDKVTFEFPQDMAEVIYHADVLFFPQGKRVGGRNAGKFKDLSFERTVKEIKDFFRRRIPSTYNAAVGKAGGIQARGAFPGTYADYEKNDPSIKLPLMQIPRSLRIYGDDFTRYLRMWVKDLGFSEDPEGHGYGIFPP